MSTQVQMGTGEIKNIVAVASGKGGVGKSTVTTNLAFALAHLGFKVGVLDADLYGPSQPCMMGSDEKPRGEGGAIVPVEKDGVKFVSMGMMNQDGKAMIIRAPLAIKALQQFLMGTLWGSLDYLFVDMPPGTGDIQLTLAQQAKFSGAIIVTTPQKVAMNIAKKGLEMFVTLNVPILGVIENMSGFSCSHCNETTLIFKKGGASELSKELKVPFLGSIPLDPSIMMSGDEGEPVVLADPSSTPAKAFLELSKTVEKNMEDVQKEARVNEPINITLEAGNLKLVWSDSILGEISAFNLRLDCPCANCVDENTGKKILKEEQIPLNIAITNTRKVGRYGLSVQFSDGHNTGIFKYKSLKEKVGGENVSESFHV